MWQKMHRKANAVTPLTVIMIEMMVISAPCGLQGYESGPPSFPGRVSLNPVTKLRFGSSRCLWPVSRANYLELFMLRRMHEMQAIVTDACGVFPCAGVIQCSLCQVILVSCYVVYLVNLVFIVDIKCS